LGLRSATMADKTSSPGQLRFGRANLVLLGAAIVCLGAGYALLSRGSTTPAAVLLVLGYCVLFPLGLAL
jgi:hypothetical protein